MKLTSKQLKKMIQEELETVQEIVGYDENNPIEAALMKMRDAMVSGKYIAAIEQAIQKDPKAWNNAMAKIYQDRRPQE